MKRGIKNYLLDNLSYKLVSLFIALILVLAILGRRDVVMSKSMELDFAMKAEQLIVGQSADEVRVKIQGPRAALKRFIEQSGYPIVVLDVTSLGQGVHQVPVPERKIEVPFGLKVVSVRPSSVRIEIKQK